MPRGYGSFRHVATDHYSSVRFSGGSVSHTGMPALPTSAPYSLMVWGWTPPGATSTIYSASGSFGVTSANLLTLSGLLTAGVSLPVGDWWTGALTFDGTVTTLYQDGEIVGATSNPGVAFTGGAGTSTMASGGAQSQLIVAPGVCFTQDQVRRFHYENVEPAAAVNLRMLEGLGTALANSGSQAGTGHTLGVNTSWTPSVPKMPPVFSIDSGSMVLDGTTNGTLTPNAGGLTALASLYGGPGITLAAWIKPHPGNDGSRYPLAMSNGTTLLRAIADAAGVGNVQWSNIRANVSSAVSNQIARPRVAGFGRWMRLGVSVDVINGVIETSLDRVIQTRDVNVAHVSPSWYAGSTVADFRIGAGAGNGANSQWFGRVADVACWRRPFSRADWAADFRGASPTADIRWRFRDGFGSSLAPGAGSIAASLAVGSGAVWSTESPRA
jgi:hypothetical protein